MSTARWWHALDGGKVQCDLCPRACRLRDGQRGTCFVRANTGGRLELTTYGRVSGFAVDPVEKKPLYHVAPGARVVSFGTAGCNLACRFCQNWELSAARNLDGLTRPARPSEVADLARAQGCAGVAYTYNDPVIFAEYALDVAQAVHEAGLLNIAVTAGSINPTPRAEFFAAMDAANIDLKSFDAGFYRRLCGGRLDAVLDTLRYVVRETSCWVEVTTLVIPGRNDSDAELTALAGWLVDELGPTVPWHVTAFHPDHQMRDVPPTPLATLRRARQIGLDAGLAFVYTGNLPDPDGSTTRCPACRASLVERDGYRVGRVAVTPDGRCGECGAAVPGRWEHPASAKSAPAHPHR